MGSRRHVIGEWNVELGVARKGRLRRPRKLLKLLARRSYRAALRHGVAAAIEHEGVAFRHHFRTVVDVGAHRGQFAVLAWRRFPHAALYCIEPLGEEQKTLRRVLDGHPKLEIIDAAAAGVSGPANLHVSRLSDSSSLRPITSKYTTAFPGTDEVRSVAVEAVTLDDMFRGHEPPRPCLVKIDVQGGELEVLAGAEKLLRGVDEIFVECSFVEFYEGQALIDQVIDHLHGCGFRLTGIYSVVRDGRGRCLQADLLFAR